MFWNAHSEKENKLGRNITPEFKCDRLQKEMKRTKETDCDRTAGTNQTFHPLELSLIPWFGSWLHCVLQKSSSIFQLDGFPKLLTDRLWSWNLVTSLNSKEMHLWRYENIHFQDEAANGSIFGVTWAAAVTERSVKRSWVTGPCGGACTSMVGSNYIYLSGLFFLKKYF